MSEIRDSNAGLSFVRVSSMVPHTQKSIYVMLHRKTTIVDTVLRTQLMFWDPKQNQCNESIIHVRKSVKHVIGSGQTISIPGRLQLFCTSRKLSNDRQNGWYAFMISS